MIEASIQHSAASKVWMPAMFAKKNQTASNAEDSKTSTVSMADKLQQVVEKIKILAASDDKDNEWAKEAVRKTYFDSELMQIPTDKLRKLCPELFSQILEPAYAQATNVGKRFKAPEFPKYITLQDSANLSFGWDDFEVGLPFLKDHSIQESIDHVSHEFGRSHHNVPYQSEEHPEPKPNAAKFGDYELSERYDADRYTNAGSMIRSLLSEITNHPESSNELDNELNHNRIELLVRKLMSDEVFGLNGWWTEQQGKPAFVPRPLRTSHTDIQEEAKRKYSLTFKDKKSIPESVADLPVTEQGELVSNWKELSAATNQKAEELMKSLDQLVASGLTPAKKEGWLEMVQKEVDKFKASHKPEFVSRIGQSRAERILNRSMNGQKSMHF